MVRTVIVDDNEQYLMRVKDLLAADHCIEVVGEAHTGREAIQITSETKPDLVLMDIRMPEIDGLQATRKIKEDFPNLKVIIISIINIDHYQNAGHKAGADGFIVKKTIQRELIPAIYKLFGMGE